MSNDLVISAYNIHQGGGKVLLNELILSLPEKTSGTILIDSRFNKLNTHNSHGWNFLEFKPTILGRIKAEVALKRLSKTHKAVLCFGNLPPLFKIKSKVHIYIQSKFLIKRNFICWLNLKTILRTFVEKLWFETRKSKKYTFYVQTESMKKAFIENQTSKFKCSIFAFAPQVKPINLNPITNESFFIYIASGEPHKNHRNLVNAWIELAKLNIYPKLTLVLDLEVYKNLTCWISEVCKIHNLNIEIIGNLNRDEVLKYLSCSKALIFPSLYESFGLPLIEAFNLNVPIIAGELDYVRDVCTPIETFDPKSPRSISRAICRFLDKEDKTIKIQTGKDFLEKIIFENNNE